MRYKITDIYKNVLIMISVFAGVVHDCVDLIIRVLDLYSCWFWPVHLNNPFPYNINIPLFAFEMAYA